MKYQETHEWVNIEGNVATIGISDHAQDQLSDIIFIDLPEVGAEINKGSEFMSVESVKSASDIYAPVSGTVVEVNETLGDSPELVNESAESDGWLVKIEIEEGLDLSHLKSKEDYLSEIED
jgi:glycine cleavage system H protein